MKKIFILLITILLFLCFGGCSKKGQVLYVYTWADYMAPEVVEQFQKQFNCRVVVDTFDSNESMYAKLKAGAKGYDVIFPSSYMVQIMRDQNMLLPLDHALLSNLGNLDSTYIKIINDPALTYSIPYAVTITGIAYLENHVENPTASWTMFERADLNGRMTMLNDMRETIGAALKYLGYSLNTTDIAQLEQARDVVINWKKNLAKFENEQYKSGLASEEFYLVHGYSGDILQVQEENENINFAVPIEGVSVSMDEMVIPSFSTNTKLAYAFINFFLDSTVSAQNTEFTSYLCPNSASYHLLSEELLNDPILFPPAETQQRFEVIKDLGEDNTKYTQIWDEIKAAQ